MDYRIEEMKSDDQYYLQHIIKYIEYLEFKIDIKKIKRLNLNITHINTKAYHLAQ